MSEIFCSRNHEHAVFDFSGKRVRKNGKCLSKFDLSWEISHINPFDAFGIYPDAFLYKEYADRLFNLLCKNS